MLSFTLAANRTQTPARDILSGTELRYLNNSVMNAAFALPTFVKNLIEE